MLLGRATGGARSCACAHAWRAGEKSGFGVREGAPDQLVAVLSIWGNWTGAVGHCPVRWGGTGNAQAGYPLANGYLGNRVGGRYQGGKTCPVDLSISGTGTSSGYISKWNILAGCSCH
jgi:hypothetical protein